MAHELEIRDGKANMMYVGMTPWHGLGTRLINPPTIEEAIVQAGLDWTVDTKPLYTADGEAVPALATYRQSDNSLLGVVGPQYKVLQNREAFEWFNPLLESKSVALETAGSLRQGRRIWILAKIANAVSEVVKGDPVEGYVLLSNSHDGTTAVCAGFTPIRVVCANTLAAASNNTSSKLIRLRHRGKLVENLELVRDVMNVAAQDFQASMEQYKMLASRQINAQDLEKYVKIVFKQPSQAQSETAGDRILNKIVPLFEAGMGTDQSNVRGSLWNAYNSITEFLQHHRGKDEELRLDNAWFGTGAALNKKALDVALNMLQPAA